MHYMYICVLYSCKIAGVFSQKKIRLYKFCTRNRETDVDCRIPLLLGEVNITHMYIYVWPLNRESLPKSYQRLPNGQTQRNPKLRIRACSLSRERQHGWLALTGTLVG